MSRPISPLFPGISAHPFFQSGHGTGSTAGSHRAVGPLWRRCIQTELQGWVLCTAPSPGQTPGPPAVPHSSWSVTGDKTNASRICSLHDQLPKRSHHKSRGEQSFSHMRMCCDPKTWSHVAETPFFTLNEFMLSVSGMLVGVTDAVWKKKSASLNVFLFFPVTFKNNCKAET